MTDYYKRNEKYEYKDDFDELTEEEIDALRKQLEELGPYALYLRELEADIRYLVHRIRKLCGIKESDTGLAPLSLWNLRLDRLTMSTEPSLRVGNVKQIDDTEKDGPRFLIHLKHYGRYVVKLAKKVAPSDIQDGMRVAMDKKNFQIQLPLPPKIDPSVSMMQVEERPNITYADIGGCKEQIEKIREVVEAPLICPDRFVKMGIDPPKGVLLYGPPGTGKTLCARAVANRTDACFIRVIGSELVQRYTGGGAHIVRNIFELARSKRACIIFFDEIDAIGGTRFYDGMGGDSEIQRTMLEILSQLDGFDPRGNIKVLMATNRPDTLDPALVRPGRLDRRIEFSLLDLAGRGHVFKIHTKQMNVERNIRYDLLARLCPNNTGADIRSVCTEAGMFAIRERRKVATEKDFLAAIEKVIKNYGKFSSTPRYLIHN